MRYRARREAQNRKHRGIAKLRRPHRLNFCDVIMPSKLYSFSFIDDGIIEDGKICRGSNDFERGKRGGGAKSFGRETKRNVFRAILEEYGKVI